MTLEALREICLSFEGVTEDIKWGHDICFSIGKKMFFVTNADSYPIGASFKTRDEDFDELIEQEGFSPAPYLARHKWVYVADISLVSQDNWRNHISVSYRLVQEKLLKNKKNRNE